MASRYARRVSACEQSARSPSTEIEHDRNAIAAYHSIFVPADVYYQALLSFPTCEKSHIKEIRVIKYIAGGP